MSIVSNASALINLARISKLDLLRQLYGELIIPGAVWQEVVIERAGQPGADEVKVAVWIKTQAVTNRQLLQALQQDLDAGEMEEGIMNTDNVKQPRRPTHLSDYAVACLQTLADHGLGDKISLGGALGLLHYLDYRPTHDVDAWWDASVTVEDQRQVIRVVETTLESFGQVKTRAWGDVVSVELLQEGQVVFSFQIARRSAQLEPSAPAPWTDVFLDSFPDLVASKMVALVERGAPRDFRDIYALCQAGLTTPRECWALWRRRQRLAGSDTDSTRARLAVETHLARIALHRPLAQIADSQQRVEAEGVRSWFTEKFLNALQ